MKLEELRRLEQAATPGEWRPEGSHVYGPKDSRSQYKNGRQLVATATDLPLGRQESFSPNNADAALIAAARNALPALLRVAGIAQEVRAALHLNGVDTEAMRESFEGIEERLAAALAALETQP